MCRSQIVKNVKDIHGFAKVSDARDAVALANWALAKWAFINWALEKEHWQIEHLQLSLQQL